MKEHPFQVSHGIIFAAGADRFEVPADWKKDLPKAAAKDREEYTCPKTGT